MPLTVYAHISASDVIGQGYQLTVVHVGDVSLFFQDGDPIPQMERLRDELDRQIDAIKLERAKPVSVPADPEPPVGHCGCPVDGPHGAGCPTIFGDFARPEGAQPRAATAFCSSHGSYYSGYSECPYCVTEKDQGQIEEVPLNQDSTHDDDMKRYTVKIHSMDCKCLDCTTPF